jgi:spoIIIJ-associated protein
MSLQSKQVYESQAVTVDEAIAAGLAKLGVNRDAVEVEILDEGSKGFLGLGSREATVRLTVKAARNAPARSAPTRNAPTPAAKATPRATPTPPPAVVREQPAATGDAAADSAEADLALETVQTLLEKMRIKAEASLRYSEPDDVTGEQLPIVDVRGRDLAVIIGPRGEILDALQYISRLMVGNQLRQRARFLIDVESYRERREQALTRLAERMAEKAIKSGRPVTLEAMPPNERRVIHMALRQNPDVTTQSDGEGPRRRVRIFPKT